MSLDDLVTLLVILIGVVSFASRALRTRGRSQPSAKPAPPRQGAAQAKPGQPPQPTVASADAAFEKRLEEARKRVEEANAQAQTTSRRAARQLRAPLEPAPTSDLFRAAPPAPPAAPPRPYAFTADEAPRASAVSPPLQVKRRRRPKSATLEAGLLGLSHEDLLRGVLWQQILNPPRAKEPHGRELSRRP